MESSLIKSFDASITLEGGNTAASRGHERRTSQTTAGTSLTGDVFGSRRSRRPSNDVQGSIPTGRTTSPMHSRIRKLSGLGFLSATTSFDDDGASTKAIRPDSAYGLHIETEPPTPTVSSIPLTPLLSPNEYPPSHYLHSPKPPERTHSSHSPRLPHALVLSKLEIAKQSVQYALLEILQMGTIVLDPPDEKECWSSDFRGVPADDGHRSPVSGPERSWSLPQGFIVVYVCPLGDGRERPPLVKPLVSRVSLIQKGKCLRT